MAADRVRVLGLCSVGPTREASSPKADRGEGESSQRGNRLHRQEGKEPRLNRILWSDQPNRLAFTIVRYRGLEEAFGSMSRLIFCVPARVDASSETRRRVACLEIRQLASRPDTV